MHNPNVVYSSLQIAWKHFNDGLFEGKLDPVLFTIVHSQSSEGYFWPLVYAIPSDGEEGEQRRHELAMNPAAFNGRTDEDFLYTFVHEMCHVWQYQFGTFSKGGYHNKEWASKMKEVGLKPYNTKAPEKETGYTLNHTPIEGGKAEALTGELLKDGWGFRIRAALDITVQGVQHKQEEKRRRQTRKHKYQCARCAAQAYGKADLHIICGACNERMNEA